MGLFNRKKKVKRILKRVISIQASVPEGSKDYVIIESMLTGIPINVSVPGTTNAYRTYEVQVGETYRKYNSFADFGSQQLRTIVDLRTAFIAGEGISISCQDERTAAWIETFLRRNELTGSGLRGQGRGDGRPVPVPAEGGDLEGRIGLHQNVKSAVCFQDTLSGGLLGRAYPGQDHRHSDQKGWNVGVSRIRELHLREDRRGRYE